MTKQLKNDGFVHSFFSLFLLHLLTLTHTQAEMGVNQAKKKAGIGKEGDQQLTSASQGEKKRQVTAKTQLHNYSTGRLIRKTLVSNS